MKVPVQSKGDPRQILPVWCKSAWMSASTLQQLYTDCGCLSGSKIIKADRGTKQGLNEAAHNGLLVRLACTLQRPDAQMRWSPIVPVHPTGANDYGTARPRACGGEHGGGAVVVSLPVGVDVGAVCGLSCVGEVPCLRKRCVESRSNVMLLAS